MGYLKAQQFDVLPLPSNSEFWVKFRKVAPWGVRIESQGAMLKVTAQAASPEDAANGNVGVVSEAEWAGYMRTLIRGFIVEWNLTDENEQPLPINDASINALADEDGQFLAGEAQQRSQLRTVAAAGPFERPSRRRSSTNRR